LFQRLIAEENRTYSTVKELLESRRKDRPPEEQIEFVDNIDDPRVHAVIIKMNGVFFVVFRGTVIAFLRFVSMVTDLLSDGRFAKVAAPALDREIAFHRGFYRAVAGTLDKIYSAIRDHCATGNIARPVIYVTGHSLGGAMAAIMNAHWNYSTYDLRRTQSFPIRSTYTFGMPRFIGSNTKVALQADQEHRMLRRNRHEPPIGLNFPFHLSNFGDSVPHLPMHYLDFADSPEEWSTLNGSRVDLEIKKREDDLAFQNLFNRSGIQGHEVDLYIRNTSFLAGLA